MADLTSIYRKENLRDKIIQACVDLVEHLADEHKSIFTEYGFLDLLDSEGGTQPPKSKFIHKTEKGFVRFLQIRDFSSENTPTFIPVDKKNKLCSKEDILLGRYGASVGKILTGKEGAYNVACAKMIILDRKKLSEKYLFYLFHSSKIQNTLQGITRGAQAGFNKGDLGKIKIVLPDINYQEKIVDLLFKLDRHLVFKEEFEIRKDEKDNFLKSFSENILKKVYTIKLIDNIGFSFEESIDFITQLRQSILQEAVQGKLVKQNKNDEPASELLKRIKAEKEKLIKQGKLKKEKEVEPILENEIQFPLPVNWEWCKFTDVCELITDGTQQTPSYREQGRIFLSALNVKPFRFMPDNHRYVSEEDYQLYIKSKKAEKGDILMTRVGAGIGEAAVIDVDIDFAFYVSLCLIKPFKKYIYPSYAELFLNSPIGRAGSSRDTYGKGTSAGNLNLGLIRSVHFPLPPFPEQKRIVDKVNQLMQHCNELEQQVQQSITHSQQLMQAVLREVFEGKEKKYSLTEQPLRMVAEK
jgi:type I restriction enzyme S subunit